jgi:hypothetical protein
VLAPAIAAAGTADVRAHFAVPAAEPLTEQAILQSVLKVTPLSLSYMEVAQRLMLQKLGHASWVDPSGKLTDRSCRYGDHPIDCAFDGWAVYFTFDDQLYLNGVCVQASSGKTPACSKG